MKFNDTDMSPIRRTRQARIVRAARTTFIAQGFRSVTMTDLAKQADVSKATLYSYFPDKIALFEAVVDSLIMEARDGVFAALSSTAPVWGRIHRALYFKHTLIREQVRVSAHAQDLFAAHNAHSIQRFRVLDHTIEAEIADQIGSVDRARQLMAASMGIANRAETQEQLDQDLLALIEAFKSLSQ